MEIQHYLKYYEYWRKANGIKFLLKNFIRITKMYSQLKELCYKFEMQDEFNKFFESTVKYNSKFSDAYLGRLLKSWEIRQGVDYYYYLKHLFKHKEN